MQTTLNLGADVDSRFVVIACAVRSFAPRRIANNRTALRSWLRTVPRGSRLGMESTGSYHELLADLAAAAGLEVFVINPRRLRRYAQALGHRGKTDRLDAETIARFVAQEHAQLHAYVPPSPQQRTLGRLLKRRGKLVAMRDGLRQSLRGVPGISAEVKRLMRSYERLIGRLDALIRKALHELPAAEQAAKNIATIPGYGALGSSTLGYAFTRLPYANGDAVIAATGFDPRPDDSGQRRGRRRLSKQGPSEQRRVLFDCAMAAVRTKQWKPYYLAQRAKGLSSTAAIVVLARKMIRMAFSLYKHNVPFDREFAARTT